MTPPANYLGDLEAVRAAIRDALNQGDHVQANRLFRDWFNRAKRNPDVATSMIFIDRDRLEAMINRS